jgi:hypothetical protein
MRRKAHWSGVTGFAAFGTGIAGGSPEGGVGGVIMYDLETETEAATPQPYAGEKVAAMYASFEAANAVPVPEDRACDTARSRLKRRSGQFVGTLRR